MSASASTDDAAKSPQDLVGIITSRGYHALLLVAALLGLPVAVCAFFFLAALTWLENYLWETVPRQLGWEDPQLWYTVLVLVVAGLVVGLVIVYLPGRGGHLPVKGFGGDSTVPVQLPGVILAAVGGLALGVVLGPESPLIALGGGLMLLALDRTKLRNSPQALTLLAAAGSAAAVATVFGNPLVAVVLMLEVVGLAGAQVLLVLLPCAASAGLAALMFTGLGSWTGINVPTLTIPGLPLANIDFADLLWTVPVAILCAVGASLVRRVGIQATKFTRNQTVLRTAVAGLLVSLCAVAYVLITDRSPLDVLQSGESALPRLVSSPESWPVVAIVCLLVFKGLAYGISLGSFRGGPTFPAIFLGAAIGILVGPLPGLGITAGIAIGMSAATTATLRLPVTSMVLVVLLLGNEGTSQIPVVMLASVIGLVTAVALDGRSREALAEIDAEPTGSSTAATPAGPSPA